MTLHQWKICWWDPGDWGIRRVTGSEETHSTLPCWPDRIRAPMVSEDGSRVAKEGKRWVKKPIQTCWNWNKVTTFIQVWFPPSSHQVVCYSGRAVAVRRASPSQPARTVLSPGDTVALEWGIFCFFCHRLFGQCQLNGPLAWIWLQHKVLLNP